MMKATVFGMNCKEIIISLALLYQAKKNTSLSAYGGQRHKRYLQEHNRTFYTTLLTSGKLNEYLADVDKQAKECFERLVEQMKQSQDITEQLKSENALEWVQKMNSIRACAIEVVNNEIIYA